MTACLRILINTNLYINIGSTICVSPEANSDANNGGRMRIQGETDYLGTEQTPAKAAAQASSNSKARQGSPIPAAKGRPIERNKTTAEQVPITG